MRRLCNAHEVLLILDESSRAGVTEMVLVIGAIRPTISSIARLTNRTSLLRIGDLDERLAIENAATAMLAKKRG